MSNNIDINNYILYIDSAGLHNCKIQYTVFTMTHIGRLSLRINSPTVSMILLLVIQIASSYKILITGVQARSHMFDQLTVAEALVLRGHDVYYGVSSRYTRLF